MNSLNQHSIKQLHILVIEDNPTTLKKIKTTLENEKYHLSLASNAKEALNYLDQNKFDLIIQDLILPDMSYIDLCKKIKSHVNGNQVPILALSGFLNRLKESEFKQYFYNLLLKPIDTQQLIEIVRSFSVPHQEMQKIGEQYTLLIVDDNHAQRKLYEINLSRYGFYVESAKNGHEALRKIKSLKPDIVISDVLMPGMDGFELCLKIKNNLNYSHIPIILLSSQYLEVQDKELAKKVYADYYMTRTNDFDSLIETLFKCINKTKKLNHIGIDNSELFNQNHNERLTNQLEKQISINENLAQRCAIKRAQLSIYNQFAKSLMKDFHTETTLKHVLHTCLDTAGISHGALFLVHKKNKINLKHSVGFNDEIVSKLEPFVNLNQIKNKILCGGQSSIIINCVEDKLINEKLGITFVKSIIIIPIMCGSQLLGVVLLGLDELQSDSEFFSIFINNLVSQIGQSLALERTIKKIYFSEKRYRILMDNASCGIFIINTRGKIIQVNKKGEKLLNTSKNQIIDSNFKKFIYDDDASKFKLYLKAMKKTPMSFPVELRIKAVNLPIKYVEYSGAQVKMENESVFILIATDVTEKNKLKSQALLNDKLAAVGKLVAGVAHEINNPITWIMTNLSVIKDGVSGMSKLIHDMTLIKNETNVREKIKLLDSVVINTSHKMFSEFDTMINESLEGVERISDIVNNFKRFSRTDNSDLNLVDIHDAIETSINMASLRFKYRTTFTKQYAQDKLSVLANKGKLTQVFLNLIINAAQALSENDPHHNLIRIETKIKNKDICIDVIDNGKGISPDDLPYIFDPFFTTKSANDGTGLGLSICQEIISVFKGHIQVSSIANQGSTFSVYLPIAQIDSCSRYKNDLSIVSSDKIKKKILIIDDESYLLNSLSKLLGTLYTTQTALGGNTAIQFLQQDPNYDAIICDLQMPEMNGSDFYYHVLNHYSGLEKRIIFTTGGLYSPSLKQFLSEVKNTVLEKPFSRNDLLQSLERV